MRIKSLFSKKYIKYEDTNRRDKKKSFTQQLLKPSQENTLKNKCLFYEIFLIVKNLNKGHE